MWSKKLRNKQGYMLLESLIGLSMIAVSLHLLVPHAIQIFQTLQQTGKEVELWRVAQDQMRVIAESGTPAATVTSAGIVFRIGWDPDSEGLTIEGEAGQEGVLVHVSEVQGTVR
ncbi:Hypothetical protein Tpal_906 [Trichococcus palustris]|jgi:type II secretory pathway pseudopilin PulG|uniref:Uncharacterized protein n=1 Tax=Trichococcus palustris TaxID=140314 RepID=A0A143YEG7_9LACT|nr:hypothetical protein [Trichococcus palustris]CZQ87507.1 Hypothetical protein Tpal_906 [Trichococcus palustris]SFK78729.1 hypothetical protein SAMN04488076_10552 [Trichococcus palustris]